MVSCDTATAYFFYGTLMDDDVRGLVLPNARRSVPVVPASLRGHRRVVLRGRDYPVIVPDAGSNVGGILVCGLERDAARRLSAFEGAEFTPRAHAVETAGGDRVTAWVFVASTVARPSSEAWDLESWRRGHKREFMRRLRNGRTA